jgi:hypothetical protein
MMDQSNFPDRLNAEGINFKGYGVLPKYVMYDRELTLTAKAIYAYFCSFAGQGTTVFPSRDKILADLRICKDTYYRHFHLLLEQGYITVVQTRTANNRHGHNIYTLVSQPPKFSVKQSDPKKAETYARIMTSGLKSLGYGKIPKAVMQDQRLSVVEKGIYSYFSSHAGSGNVACPKKANLLYHLHISETMYYRHYKILLDLNYLVAVRRRNANGSLSINDYYIVDHPDITPTLPCEQIEAKEQGAAMPFRQPDIEIPSSPQNPSLQNQETASQDAAKCIIMENPEAQLHPQKYDTAIQYASNRRILENQGVQSSPQTSDTANPAFKNNNFENQQHKINQSIFKNQNPAPGQTNVLIPDRKNIPAPGRPIVLNYSGGSSEIQDGWMDRTETYDGTYDWIETVLADLRTEKKIPIGYLQSRKISCLQTAIHIITEYDQKVQSFTKSSEKDRYEFSHKVFLLFNEALIEMLTSRSLMNLKGAYVSYSMVYDKLSEYLKYIEDPKYGEYFEIQELIDVATNDFENAYRNTKIKNNLQYMKACIWNAMQTHGIQTVHFSGLY